MPAGYHEVDVNSTLHPSLNPVCDQQTIFNFPAQLPPQLPHDPVMSDSTKPITPAERERDAARDELAAARVVLSEAVGHEDEPHETLAEVAALLVLDCDSEHSRACTAERELAELERELAKLRKEHSDECPQSNTRGEGSSP